MSDILWPPRSGRLLRRRASRFPWVVLWALSVVGAFYVGRACPAQPVVVAEVEDLYDVTFATVEALSECEMIMAVAWDAVGVANSEADDVRQRYVRSAVQTASIVQAMPFLCEQGVRNLGVRRDRVEALAQAEPNLVADLPMD